MSHHDETPGAWMGSAIRATGLPAGFLEEACAEADRRPVLLAEPGSRRVVPIRRPGLTSGDPKVDIHTRDK